MPLAAGTKLGPYEVVSLVGSGGMGEVYKARDARLGRDVAIKILPASITNETERLKRFEQEARSVAALNHPNILTIYEIETHDGSPYLVSELLEGETLQQRLREGALPVRKALEIAVQAAHGVAAAHEKGIVHRDLKPANIFLTSDGRVKILDFGLAKLTQPDSQNAGSQHDATQTRAVDRGPVTEEGVVLGTAGYMSPEQVRGKAADSRSDIFALGTILYEMLSGRRAFQRDSSADTMAAILKEDPPELSGEGKPIPPGVDRVVRHALEKNPNERFQSARDFAFDLESLSGGSTSVSGTSSAAAANAAAEAAAKARAEAQASSMGRKLALAIGAVALASIAGAAGWLIARETLHAATPKFTRLTFKRGYIDSARFLPDAQSVFYTAGWDGAARDVFEQRLDSPEARSAGLPKDTTVLAVSPSGELAVMLKTRVAGPFQYQGTLAEIPPSGSAPRELATFVTSADWSPDGKQIAAVRFPSPATEVIEYPLGKVLYETHGWMGSVRVAPDGQHIAFIDHDDWSDDGGAVAVVDMAGKKTRLTQVWSSARGLAWHGNEIYFTATMTGEARSLNSVTLSGRQRTVTTTPGAMNVEDVAKDGRVLYSQNDERIEMAVVDVHGDAPPRPLSWLDWSLISDISADGKTVVFGESGEASGDAYGIFIRNIDGSPAIRLGDGDFGAISPDGKWVAVRSTSPNTPQGMVILPTGAGQPRKVEGISGNGMGWAPDSKTVVFTRREADNTDRVYAESMDGGPARALTPANDSLAGPRHPVSPDGKFLVARRQQDGATFLFPFEGGAGKELTMIKHGEYVNGWSADSKSVFVNTRGSVLDGSEIYKIDIETGKRDLIKTLMPADRAGLQGFDGQFTARDGSVIAFSYTRILSTLYVLTPAK